MEVSIESSFFVSSPKLSSMIVKVSSKGEAETGQETQEERIESHNEIQRHHVENIRVKAEIWI